MAIFEAFNTKLNDIREKIEEFKSNHKMANQAISVIVSSMPEPFGKFASIIWEGMEQKDSSGIELLQIMEKFETKHELLFMNQTTQISQLLEKTANKDDIIKMDQEIKKSHQ